MKQRFGETEYVNTIFSNYFLIAEKGETVGLVINPEEEGERRFFIGDIVKVTPDSYGYICPGIKKPGLGIVVDVSPDDTGHFFTVYTENGERGVCKDNRITVLSIIPELSIDVHAAFAKVLRDFVREKDEHEQLLGGKLEF